MQLMRRGQAPAFEVVYERHSSAAFSLAYRIVGTRNGAEDVTQEAFLSITEMAAGELEAWELSAMRDPRNWARPAAALLAGTAAGTALVVLRARRRAQATPTRSVAGVRKAAERTLQDIERETRKLLGDR